MPSTLDSLVYKYLIENGQTEAAKILKEKNPSIDKVKTKKNLATIFEQFQSK
ncbi:uncharacterized protein BX663DRAFT_509770 [Cokeromyces recurvatus]|uniref:uncharacterized protein n=1 Tax=Cokeromyces recurvatus TaxID=90255 RepID=UPI00221FB7B7|nr:uncharacterized protein BX663DRAFT_509770 [Cokeromyces recurvatus]KAI7902592.1 hypothetical protein BX663DRAFT_509770 [Cokeromyces recurvatus]